MSKSPKKQKKDLFNGMTPKIDKLLVKNYKAKVKYEKQKKRRWCPYHETKEECIGAQPQTEKECLHKKLRRTNLTYFCIDCGEREPQDTCSCHCHPQNQVCYFIKENNRRYFNGLPRIMDTCPKSCSHCSKPSMEVVQSGKVSFFPVDTEKWDRERELVRKHNDELIEKWWSTPWWKSWDKPSSEEQKTIILDNWKKFGQLPIPRLPMDKHSKQCDHINFRCYCYDYIDKAEEDWEEKFDKEYGGRDYIDCHISTIKDDIRLWIERATRKARQSTLKEVGEVLNIHNGHSNKSDACLSEIKRKLSKLLDNHDI